MILHFIKRDFRSKALYWAVLGVCAILFVGYYLVFGNSDRSIILWAAYGGWLFAMTATADMAGVTWRCVRSAVPQLVRVMLVADRWLERAEPAPST